MSNDNRINLDQKYYIRINEVFDLNKSIFNQFSFLSLHMNKYLNLYSFSLYDNKDNNIGVCNFGTNSNGIFISPIAGSYGGFEFDSLVSLSVKQLFIEYVINYILNEGAKEILITLPPNIYDLHNNSELLSILFRNRFILKSLELNQYIYIPTYSKNTSISYAVRCNSCKCHY